MIDNSISFPTTTLTQCLEKIFKWSLSFASSGSNNLKNTNQLTSNITNNFKYSSPNNVNKFGFRNEYNFNLKILIK